MRFFVQIDAKRLKILQKTPTNSFVKYEFYQKATIFRTTTALGSFVYYKQEKTENNQKEIETTSPPLLERS